MDNMSFICEGCGDHIVTDNEDSCVVGLCDGCLEYGFEHVEGSRYSVQDYCGCEDYPCCGH